MITSINQSVNHAVVDAPYSSLKKWTAGTDIICD